MKSDNIGKLVVFAADGVDTEDRAENLVHWFTYHGFTIKAVQGVYKGMREPAFVASYSIINHPLFQYLTQGQETILILGEAQGNGKRASYLLSPVDAIAGNEGKGFIGYWNALEGLPPVGEDYTYCPQNNTYYTIKTA